MAAPGSGPDIEELVKRVTAHPGVRGFLILNHEGIAIRHSFTRASHDLTVQYAALFQSLTIKAKEVVTEMDNSNNELQMLRLRSKKHEIIIAPDSKYLLIVIQKPDGYVVDSEEAIMTGATAE